MTEANAFEPGELHDTKFLCIPFIDVFEGIFSFYRSLS